MTSFNVEGLLLFIKPGKLKRFSLDVKALSANDVYNELLSELPVDQTDLFEINSSISDKVLFCGIRSNKNTWQCPLTDGFVRITPK